MIKHDQLANKCGSSCGCHTGDVNRRDFLRFAGAGSLGLLAMRLPAMAGPFTREDFEKLVPADKKLSADWIKSLFARGTPEVYRGEELKWIGMPIGGLCAGQLYLGGDGKLWHWDIFNQHIRTADKHYAHPMKPASPVEQGFTLKIGEVATPLEKFSSISFRGEYPFGLVEYQEKDVAVTLEAFSPFIPLNTDDSSLPATVMRLTVKNTGSQKLEAELTGHLAKAGMDSRLVKGNGFTFLECASELPSAPAPMDLTFEDWNKETYDGWKVEGTAFGTGPIKKSAIPEYQGDIGGDTERIVNSHATAPGNDVGAKDGATGKLTSRPFTIERGFVNFWIAGGNHQGKTCLNLLVGGKVLQSATGPANNRMVLKNFDVRALKGRNAIIEIVDAGEGGWGNIGVGRITFSDVPARTGKPTSAPDFGSLGLALLGEGDTLGRKLSLAPGLSAVVSFVVTWHFPNWKMDIVEGSGLPFGRFYATKFDSALAVAQYVADHFDRLYRETRLWRDTWYDSTLPWWFLDRTMLNTSILATSTCCRFKSGRFYSDEGVGCCGGTCGHVWHYAHAPARLFPEFERDLHERMDFGRAQKPDGSIMFRGDHRGFYLIAVDSQAGYILRALREHLMSKDSTWLKSLWPKIKLAQQYLIDKDGNGDGLIESDQHNTLDGNWFGPVAWLSGLYVASLEASEAMAREVGDAAFADICAALAASGRKSLQALYNGEYYINKVDPGHLDAINSGTGCAIDQVMGQSWAWQVGLPRVFPEQETKAALRSLWTYNFTPDVGPYRARYKTGRWYAMPGEAGLLMCSFPQKDWDFEQARGKGGPAHHAGYFNECMNGFEYQVAGHMIWEGMVQEGLAVTRAVHDRYHPHRRNPYNEIECGDHYVRSMASYGVYLAACGFEYDGPRGHIGFAPRLTPENFKAAFTAAEGWGSFAIKDSKLEIHLRWGKLRLKTIALPGKTATVKFNGKMVDATSRIENERLLIKLSVPLTIEAGQMLEIITS